MLVLAVAVRSAIPPAARHTCPMPTDARHTDRTLVVIISIVAAIAILALVVVFTRGTPPPLDPSTPEGVVQVYAQAVIAGDTPGAIELLTQDVREHCDRADRGPTTDLRLTLTSTAVTGDSAVVRVLMAGDSGGGLFLFGTSSYESEDSFSLLREDGVWKIDTAPWALAVCYNQDTY